MGYTFPAVEVLWRIVAGFMRNFSALFVPDFINTHCWYSLITTAQKDKHACQPLHYELLRKKFSAGINGHKVIIGMLA